jgi:membrane protein
VAKTGDFKATSAVAVWRALVTAVRRALEERAPEAAASIGFFAFFSLFPILLILVAVASSLLSDSQTHEQVLAAILRFVPVSRELVSRNMLAALAARGTVGLVGAIGLLWSSTSAFAILIRNLSRAWPGAAARSALRARLFALALVAALVGLVVLYLLVKSAVPLAQNWGRISGAILAFARLFRLAWKAGILGVIFGALMLLYRWVPATRVRWREAAFGSAVATAAFALTTAGFSWYLGSRFERYNIVYGSLGALVALLSWVYLLSLISLVGAHLSAAVARVTRGIGEDST